MKNKNKLVSIIILVVIAIIGVVILEESITTRNTPIVDIEVSTEHKIHEQLTNIVYITLEDSKINILPVINSEIIGELKQGDKVLLIEQANEWGYVRTEELQGWILVKNLKNGQFFK